ncbi:MAG TPA: GNAT family N-acetyltransferase [Steroidobacteraceae bacterium]|nr:GNAT family N-acetyltransferase [Steroidobacteraceae bacterium]
MKEPGIVIAPTDPRSSACEALIRELDRYLGALYPAESNHLLNLNALAAGDVRFFAAWVDGEMVGCGAIKKFRDYAEVKRVYVSPRARGRGVARRIIEALEQATREAGLGTMRLETGIYQKDALALFEKLGFSRSPCFGDYPEDDPYSIFMERTLR